MKQRRKGPSQSAPRSRAHADTLAESLAEPLLAEPLRPFIAPEDAARFWPVAGICIVACVGLGIAQFVGDTSTFLQVFPRQGSDPSLMLNIKRWWVSWTVLGFLILPAAYMLLRPGRHIRDCNLGWRGFREHVWIYVALFAAVFPVIYLVSWSPSFYEFYPMYPLAGRSMRDLLLWESLYAGQFLALEFFFRGFLVGGLGRYIGVLAVPVSVMPYMMLHFSKPWPEAYAAIFAGFILGWLAWKTKSIWGGVFIHAAVAISMDLLALAHKNQLPW
ncbi:MAG TPA: type II CAAX endopeptidase family protein [Candidatus Acidoferrales bacterium]